MTYARNQWSRAVRYVDCGLLTPDNNAAENAIRPVALGRKNWVFAGTPKGADQHKGADASAMFFSLVETAKVNEIEPQAYLKFLFERFPAAQTSEDMRALMPKHGDRYLLSSHPQAQAAQKVKAPASNADKARRLKMRMSECLLYCGRDHCLKILRRSILF